MDIGVDVLGLGGDVLGHPRLALVGQCLVRALVQQRNALRCSQLDSHGLRGHGA